jgi:hypothetical protein
VIQTLDAAISVQSILSQIAGFGVAAHYPERPGEVVRDRPSVLMVVAEPLAPTLVQIAS